MRQFRNLWAVPLLCLSLNSFAAMLMPVHSLSHTAHADQHKQISNADLTQPMAMANMAEDCCAQHMPAPPHADATCASHCAMLCSMLAVPATSQLPMAAPYPHILTALTPPQPSAAHRRALLRPPAGFIA